MSWVNIKISSVEHGSKLVLKDRVLHFEKGDKIALVGDNGSGKSTLLGQIQTTLSNQGKNNQSIKVAILKQKLDAELDCIIFDYLQGGDSSWLDVLNMLNIEFGWDLNPAKFYYELSGGEKQLLEIVKILNKDFDLLFLDEPTNNLDSANIAKLGKLIKQLKCAVLSVSHDPEFLNIFTTQLWELENGEIRIFGGNYNFYENQKQIELNRKLEQYNSAKINLKQTIQTQKEQQVLGLKRLVKGKKDAQVSGLGKAEQNYFKNRSESKSGQTKSNFDRLIEEKKLVLENLKLEAKYPIHFRFEQEIIKNKRLLSLKNGEIILNNQPLLSKLDFEVFTGQKIWLKGSNGSGKTTFLKAVLEASGKSNILNNINLSGELYKTNDLKIFYLDQDYSLVNQDLTLMENLYLADSSLDLTKIYKILAYFQFKTSDSQRLASSLSGGETVRLALAILSLNEVDLLILDEPTNNVDLATQKVIVEVLNHYKGALVVVSHNLWFVNQLNCNIIYEIALNRLIKSQLEIIE